MMRKRSGIFTGLLIGTAALIAIIAVWNLTVSRAPQTIAPVSPKPAEPVGTNRLLTSEKVEILDLASEFAGYQGCFLLYDTSEKNYRTYNPIQCEKRLTPASTFKILNSLIGLETGAVQSVDTLLPWDGHPYVFPAWNRDHTMASALTNSVTWYYKKLAIRIGKEQMEHYVRAANYGNSDTSGGVDSFWLGSSLQISALEQIHFISKLYEGTLPFSPETMDGVKKMLILEQQGENVLAGKTGTCNAGNCYSEQPQNDNLGWFVGQVQADGKSYIFAVNLEADHKANGSVAKQKAVSILKKLNLWE
ncbi:penicillin-binding transpeptidase domain-containing protein [Paenibacillus sp. FJAT-26967]|uniref:penicillin-binding transpeptidase domain-containing protein n=1 Tax=Paenibacillus sp. FJAT-26967 TaxID=1729690 RepID=UPI000837AF66|nr:penicillin-binding transpeptidase domain-containing protein [Paenibacillus sp. FJAT-26967]